MSITTHRILLGICLILVLAWLVLGTQSSFLPRGGGMGPDAGGGAVFGLIFWLVLYGPAFLWLLVLGGMFFAHFESDQYRAWLWLVYGLCGLHAGVVVVPQVWYGAREQSIRSAWRAAGAEVYIQQHAGPIRGATFRGNQCDFSILATPSAETLWSLSLQNTSFSDSDLRYLTNLREVGSVDLAGTRISNAGIKMLAGKRWDSLSVKDTQLTDACIPDLLKLRVDRLRVSGTRISADGIRELRKKKGWMVHDGNTW